MTQIELFRTAANYLAAGDPAAARFLPELERFPRFAPGWLMIGEVLLQAGRRDAAAMALHRAGQGEPRTAALTHRLGQGLVKLGDTTAAIAAFQTALSLDPGLAAAWYSLGLVLQDVRRYAEAAEAYHAALRLQPDFHEAAFNLGVALLEAGGMEAALDALATAWRMKPASFGRIAQALVSHGTGALWLRPADLRLALAERPALSRGA
jgi:tetratricopeptide (TPR) repeat protein